MNPPTTDDCQPAIQAPAPQQVFVEASPAELDMQLPIAADGRIQNQSWSIIPVQGGAFAGDSTLCGATQSLLLEVEHQDASEISVKLTDTWNAVSHADPGCSEFAALPHRDCTYAAELHYKLVLACNAPCTVAFKTDVNGKANGSCVCHGSSSP